MKRIITLFIMVIALLTVFTVVASAKEISADDTFTLKYDAGDKKVGENLALMQDGEGLIWYINGENKLISVKASEVTLVFESQNQPYTQVGKLPAHNGAECLKAIKVGDTVIQDINGAKNIVCANMQGLSFEYLYSSNNSSLFSANNNLQCLYLPNTLKRIASYGFYACENLSEFDMGESVQIIWEYAFSGLKSLEKIKLSNTALFIGNYTFKNSTSLKEIRLGESMLHIADKILDSTGENLIDLYVPTTVTHFAAPYNNFLTIFFTGDLEQAQRTLPTFGVVTYTYKPFSEFDGTRTTALLKWYAYYDVSICDAFYNGNHVTTDDGDCTTPEICQKCQNTVVKANESHNLITSITYENGFMSTGEKAEKCACCDYKSAVTAEALFTTKGYSTPSNGRGELAVCFDVNKLAVSEYEKVNNDQLQYGVFAILYDKIKDDNILDADGAISSEVSDGYVSFEIRLCGFETDLHKNAKISFGAYVIDKNGRVTYLQPSAPNEGDKYAFVSYNEIVNQ